MCKTVVKPFDSEVSGKIFFCNHRYSRCSVASKITIVARAKQSSSYS